VARAYTPNVQDVEREAFLLIILINFRFIILRLGATFETLRFSSPDRITK